MRPTTLNKSMPHRPWPMVAIFVTLWVALATIFPTRTLHIAAPIAAAWPLVGALAERRPLATSTRLAFAGAGLALAVVVTFGLDIFDRLAGPSLLPAGGAAVESYLFATIAAIGVFGLSTVWREQK